jgi:hypothetical protein
VSASIHNGYNIEKGAQMINLLRAWFNWSIFGIELGWWKFRHFANERAIILLRQGVYYDFRLAHRVYVGDLGEIFEFGESVAYVFNERKTERNEVNEVAIEQTKEQAAEIRWKYEPKHFEVFDDERILFLVDGEVITTPVVGTGVPMPVTLLSEFNRGNFADQALQSIKGPSRGFGLNWKVIAGIAAIALIGYLIWKYVLGGAIPGQTVVPSPSPTPGYTIVSWLVSYLI